MSLLEAIYKRWLSEPRLTALVPAGQVYTGRAAGDAVRPYAVIVGASAQSAVNTTHATVQKVRVELTAWFEDHASAGRLLEEVRRGYERQSFAAGDERCLLMQCEEERISADEDRGWRAIAVYRALHQRAAAS